MHKMYQASGSQRAGRAGRVRPGKCWRLYPQPFHEINMPTHTLAEMLRTPLEELVLQVNPIARGGKRRVEGADGSRLCVRAVRERGCFPL